MTAVVLEPTRNAWVPPPAWFRRCGARVILVPPEQSADPREYYSKHTKSDHLDSRMLARLPLLHPDGIHPAEGLGPADALRRAPRLRASLVKRRNVILARDRAGQQPGKGAQARAWPVQPSLHVRYSARTPGPHWRCAGSPG